MEAEMNKKLSRFWDSEICESLYAEVVAADGQNSTFFHTPLVFLSTELGITGYYDPGRLWRAGNQDNALPSYADFHLLLHYVITIHQRCRQTDGRHARSISASR